MSQIKSIADIRVCDHCGNLIKKRPKPEGFPDLCRFCHTVLMKEFEKEKEKMNSTNPTPLSDSHSSAESSDNPVS